MLVSLIVSLLEYHYPYPYNNVNWYNFQHVWPEVAGAGAIPETKSPIAPVIQAQPSIPADVNVCPKSFCPVGASCTQRSGQWQCACGQNGCSGSKEQEYLILPDWESRICRVVEQHTRIDLMTNTSKKNNCFHQVRFPESVIRINERS